MSKFWPAGIKLNDIQSPMEILRTAREEWESNSNGLLTLVFQETESKANNPMILVHAKHVPSNRTTTLFSVIHRPRAPYPATIDPREDEVPTFLRKSYTEKGSQSIRAAMEGYTTPDRIVENAWVSATPAELRYNLEKAFSLDAVKSQILNLIAADVAPGPSIEEAAERGEEESV